MSTTAEAPTFVEPSTRLLPRLQLRSVVPEDEFRVVRLALMFEFLFVYLWWLRVRGLPIDRISVAISVGLFLLSRRDVMTRLANGGCGQDSELEVVKPRVEGGDRAHPMTFRHHHRQGELRVVGNARTRHCTPMLAANP